MYMRDFASRSRTARIFWYSGESRQAVGAGAVAGLKAQAKAYIVTEVDVTGAMYARACRAWYGMRAPRIVKKRIEELRRAGDLGGVAA
jgi:hypothetical protein